jgi:hydroxymethylpyrimidine pyrophosphatase-like HAD family hydrolase
MDGPPHEEVGTGSASCFFVRALAVAIDYDGTLASSGKVAPATQAALERLKSTGRRLILVTGRVLDDLEDAFPGIAVFDRVVAENGAVVWTPAGERLDVLAEAPPPAFMRALHARGVEPLSVGRVVVATREPHQSAVLDVIRSLGADLHVELNKGAVMILPGGLTKRTGFAVALEQLRLSPRDVVAVGDAENDRAFLAICEHRVVVANALPSVIEMADWVTPSADGAGIVELVDRLLADDPRSL